MPQRCLVTALALALTAATARGQTGWSAQKCALYTQGWAWVLETQDMTGVRPEFIADHQHFIDTGCDQTLEICPVTAGEGKLVDLLTVISMNEGMASTFVPFSCPD